MDFSYVLMFVVFFTGLLILGPILMRSLKKRSRKSTASRDFHKAPSVSQEQSPVSDPEALAKAEEALKGQKSLLETYADRGYYVVETLGSIDGFSSVYVNEIVEKLKSESLRAEVIETSGTLVALDTGNFVRFQLLAHKDDADKVKAHLKRLFS